MARVSSRRGPLLLCGLRLVEAVWVCQLLAERP